MLSRGNYFSGQSSSEKVILFVRRHWMSFAPWLIATLLLYILPVILYIYLNDYFITLKLNKISLTWLVVILGSFYLFVTGIFLKSWINFYLNVTIVTTEHLVDIRQVKLFDRRVAEQSLLRVQDVSSKMSGIFQTFFHYGRVLVETAGDTPNFEIQNVPRPYIIASTIMRLHQELVDGGYRHSSKEAEGTFKRDFAADITKKYTIDDQNEIDKKDQDFNNDVDNVAPIYDYSPSKVYNQTNEQVISAIDDTKIVNKENLKSSLEGDLEDGKVIKFDS